VTMVTIVRDVHVALRKQRYADASLFSVALSCVFNVIDGFGRLPKTLEIRARQLERGLRPWADQICCCYCPQLAASVIKSTM
jgi:hypothetical protein